MLKEIDANSIKSVEKQICLAVAKDIKLCIGRGPVNTEAFIHENFVVVKVTGHLLPPELELAQSEHGFFDVKFNRLKWFHAVKDHFIKTISDLTEKRVVDFYHDVNPRKNSSVSIYFFA